MVKKDLEEPARCSKYVPKEELHDSSENEYEHLQLRHDTRDDSWDIYLPSKKRKEKHANETKIGIFTLKFAKLLTYAVTFILVLGCCIFSKVTLFLMTSQMLPNRTMLLNITGFGRNRLFEVNTPSLERMGWYWAVFFTLIVPEVMIVLKSITTCLFKTFKKPLGATFFWVFLFETIHTVGIGMLVFGVFPKLDVIRAVMLTNCLCIVPAIMTLLSQQNGKFAIYKQVVDGICLLVQIGALVVLFFQNSFEWMIIVAGLCVSFGWWENFLNPDADLPIIKGLCKIQAEMKHPNVRRFSYIFIATWKVVLYFVIMLVFLRHENLLFLLSHFEESFYSQQVNITQVWPTAMGTVPSLLQPRPLFSDDMLPIYVAAIQISTSLIAYWTGIFACKIFIQEFSFSLPATLTVPLVTFVLSSGCSYRHVKLDFLTGELPKYVFWTCPQDISFVEFLWHNKGAIWILLFLSQIWVTSHIWAPRFEEVISTERLFVLPMYNGAVIDQSLVMNRRRHRFNKKEKNGRISGRNEIYG